MDERKTCPPDCRLNVDIRARGGVDLHGVEVGVRRHRKSAFARPDMLIVGIPHVCVGRYYVKMLLATRT
jgi:hypothetical protein